MTTHDPVNSPAHYTAHPSGIECWDVIAHLPIELGNVIKYCWRWKEKNGVEDLKKALWNLKKVEPEVISLDLSMRESGFFFQRNRDLARFAYDFEPADTPLHWALSLLLSLYDNKAGAVYQNMLAVLHEATKEAH